LIIFQANYINVNGEESSITTNNTCTLLCISCLPCCVEPCGEERKSEYKKAWKSFCFFISLIDFIMLIVTIIYNKGFEPFASNPFLGPSSQTLLIFGAKYVPLIKSGEVYRFFTPIILHAGLLHLFMNLFVQLRYGLYLERLWGTLKFVIIYIISGFGSSLLSCLLNSDSISVGASGALSGLLGAHLINIIINWKKLNPSFRVNMISQVLFWIFVLLVTGSTNSYIDFWGHLGGLLNGALIAWPLNYKLGEQKGRIAQIVAPIICLIYYTIGITLIFTLYNK